MPYTRYTLLLMLALLLVQCGTSSNSGSLAPDTGGEDASNSRLDTSSSEDTQNTSEDSQSTPEDSQNAPEDTALGEDTLDDAVSDSALADLPEDTADDAEERDATPQTYRSKSLYIALDGLRPDGLAYAATPNIDRLIAGTWQPGYHGSYSPFAQNLVDAQTVSGPNHATIMTGAIGAQHGVTGNSDVASGDFQTYPHVLTLLENHNPDLGTACLFTWTPDGLITSQADYIYDGDDADNIERTANILQGVHEDSAGFYNTSWSMGAEVDAIFLFLDDGDHAGHSHGFEPGVSEYINEIATIDTQIGTLLNAIAARSNFDQENWQILITSDHGGYGTGHGGNSAIEHTIPFLVVSRDVSPGTLPDNTRIEDGVPTVLAHMGVPVPSNLSGTPRGGTSKPPAPDLGIDQALVAYYRFEGNFEDSSNAAHHAVVGPDAAVAPELRNGGPFGDYLAVRTPDSGTSYLTLGTPEGLQFGDDVSFTVTFWFRASRIQNGDPVIIGNKNWNSGGNPGWLVLANEGGGNSFGSNFSSFRDDRIDLEDVNYPADTWWFVASVFQANGSALLFAGDTNGAMRWMALDASSVGNLTTALPINIGQDGTGTYSNNLDGDLDDLAIWRRALHPDEILSMYQGGQGQELQALR